MRRRKVIALLGGAAAWPLAARAQQGERMRRVGVLMSAGADDAVTQIRYAAFLQGLQQSGWEIGRNVRIEMRWAPGSADNTRKSTAELVALAPDVILAAGSVSTGPLLQATRSVPIVFVHTPDPVGAGFVNSMSRPGGNATGGGVCRGKRSGVGGAKGGAKGNAHQQSTLWTQRQARVSKALEHIRRAFAVTHPRWEPYAGKPHVRIWAGGVR